MNEDFAVPQNKEAYLDQLLVNKQQRIAGRRDASLPGYSHDPKAMSSILDYIVSKKDNETQEKYMHEKMMLKLLRPNNC